MRVDLVLVNGGSAGQSWALGQLHAVEDDCAEMAMLIDHQSGDSSADAYLFWDSDLGWPVSAVVVELLQQPVQMWHAGLVLGMGGKPGTIDFVAPTWMLNRDPDAQIEATSWRCSPRACLIRSDVIQQLGFIDPDFISLEAAFLELGHRYVTRGAFVRHVPTLVSSAQPLDQQLPFEDELRFILYGYGRMWSRWTTARAILSGYVSVWQGIRALRVLNNIETLPALEPYQEKTDEDSVPLDRDRVTVLIPTIDRYPYLRTLLKQLGEQDVQADEIIIVDQTAKERRDVSIREEFDHLPLKTIYQEKAGQCTSRNAGLQASVGDMILFVDDDDEIPGDLISGHLRSLKRSRSNVSSGSADEVGAGPLPKHFLYRRASDVFPTNNTMIQRGVLERSGLFDLAYDQGQRADGDLGMRVYLSGELMVYDPTISVLHHHAPQGGLRTHKARVITYARSRQSIWVRHLPSVSELYLSMRYFSQRQNREALWLRAMGTLSVRGGRLKKLAKIVVSLLMMPHTVWQIARRQKEAKDMLERYPIIPELAAV